MSIGARLRALTFGGISFLGACAIAGCGKTVADDAGAPIARAELPLLIAQIYCESFAGCCEEQSLPVDAEACKTNVVARYEEELKADEASTTYHADLAGQCLAALRDNVRCGVTVNLDVLVEACRGAVVGHVKPGQPCTRWNQCEKPANGTVLCDRSEQEPSSSDPGVCLVGVTTLVHAKLGETCAYSCMDVDCDSLAGVGPDGKRRTDATADVCFREDGLYCSPNNQCAKLLPLSAACRGSEECAGGTVCALDTQICIKPRPERTPCGFDFDCESDYCDNGFCAIRRPSADACALGEPRL